MRPRPDDGKRQTDEWSGPSAFQVSYVDVTVKQPGITHRVNLMKFNDLARVRARIAS